MKVLAIFGKTDRPESEIIQGVKARGIEVTAITQPGASEVSRMEQAGIRVIPLNFRSRIDLAAAFRLRNIINREHPDIIYAFTARSLAAVVIATIGRNVPIVAYRGTMGNISRLDPTIWISWLSPKVKKLICVSEAVRQDLLKFRAESELATIYKGHALEWYKDILPLSRGELGADSSATIVCCTANMRPLKGVDVLLRAVAKIPAETPIHLLLVGEERDHRLRRLANLVPPPHKVQFTGYRSDALRYTASSDIFVMPSLRREGFPKAVIEAMAVGSVPIVSEVGGLPEIVQNGVTGLVVPAGESSELARAITELARSPERRKQMDCEGKKLFYSKLSIKCSIDETCRLLGRVAESK